jgi:hypothetical protein
MGGTLLSVGGCSRCSVELRSSERRSVRFFRPGSRSQESLSNGQHLNRNLSRQPRNERTDPYSAVAENDRETARLYGGRRCSS